MYLSAKQTGVVLGEAQNSQEDSYMPAKIKRLEEKYPDLALILQAEAEAEAKSKGKATAAPRVTNREHPDQPDPLHEAMTTYLGYHSHLFTRSLMYSKDPNISRYCSSTESIINLKSKWNKLDEAADKRTLQIDCKRYKDELLERNAGRYKSIHDRTESREYVVSMRKRKAELFNEEIGILEELEEYIEEVEKEWKKFGGVEEWIKWNKERLMGEEGCVNDGLELELVR